MPLVQTNVLRVYRKPPRAANTLAPLVPRSLLLPVVAHLLVAVWVYGNPALLPSPRSSLYLPVLTHGLHDALAAMRRAAQWDFVDVEPKLERLAVLPAAVGCVLVALCAAVALLFSTLVRPCGRRVGALLARLRCCQCTRGRTRLGTPKPARSRCWLLWCWCCWCCWRPRVYAPPPTFTGPYVVPVVPPPFSCWSWLCRVATACCCCMGCRRRGPKYTPGAGSSPGGAGASPAAASLAGGEGSPQASTGSGPPPQAASALGEEQWEVAGPWRWRVWPADGVMNGVRHMKGSPVATWQVVREGALFSYDVLLNPVFNGPNEAIQEAVANNLYRLRMRPLKPGTASGSRPGTGAAPSRSRPTTSDV